MAGMFPSLFLFIFSEILFFRDASGHTEGNYNIRVLNTVKINYGI